MTATLAPAVARPPLGDLCRGLRRRAPAVAAVFIAGLAFAPGALAQDDMAKRVEALAPRLEAYVAEGMKGFDDPGLAIGIVSGDRLIYGKGFGVRRRGGDPVDLDTVFQIGSTTKAFLATSMAIAADRKLFAWDDHVVDRAPDFQLKDAWVTREFRMFDLLAQRSGLPAYANDIVGLLGADRPAMIRSLRNVEPVSSFRSTFAYTNITHMLAQRIVAERMGEADWDSVVSREIFEPLGMKSSSFTAEAIEAAPNHTVGHRWTVQGSVEVPFTPIFPYGFGAAGSINSTINDLVPWLRLHLAGGTFEGHRIVSAANLAVTKTPRVGLSDKASYAMGWVVQSTPNGRIVWHNGGTASYGAYVGTALDKDIGIVVLSNQTNVGLPDAIGEWVLDRLMGNPDIDHVAARLTAAKAGAAATAATFAAPRTSRPGTPVATLAGAYVSPSLGAATLTPAGDGLVLELAATGAKLRLTHRDGDLFTVGVVPEGRFAAMAEDEGPDPLGFLQFTANGEGRIDRFEFLSQDNGQPYPFRRN